MRDGTGVRQIGCCTETSLSQLKGLFKVWGSLKCQTLGPPTSLHWLLEEPLVHRAHLDMACEATPGLTDLLCATGTVKLRSVADLAGPRLDASEAVASHLGVRSVRYVRSAVDRWKEALTEHEWALLMDYFAGKETPNATDPFPELSLAPDLTGLERFGSLLDSVGVEEPVFCLIGNPSLSLRTQDAQFFCPVSVLMSTVTLNGPNGLQT
ncbi:hypothetical protein GJAV_G00107250 [Gymnothorax javanicus]|nr:hypothetical protein GJAV_G00107250 [Gymnothorax javanicus]